MNTVVKTLSAALVVVWLILLAGSCSKQDSGSKDLSPAGEEQAFCADTLLPSIGVESDILPLVETRVITPKEAGDYLGDAAKLYNSYHFVGLAVSHYKVRGEPVSVEIAQFPTADDAYGFYSRLRPLGVALGMVGAESYIAGNSLYFTAGQFAVTMSVEEMTPTSNQALALLAQEINNRIGPMRTPVPFVLFPWKGKIAASDQYFVSDFLDGAGLAKVYASHYQINNDTATLFFTLDPAGEQFLALKDWAGREGRTMDVPSGLDFPDHALAFTHPHYGLIVAGLVNKKLVGIVNYRAASFEGLFAGWIKGLQ